MCKFNVQCKIVTLYSYFYFQLRIRLKQSENVTGPKVSIEVNMGALILFLSPRQVYVLIELANGLASPDNEDTRYVTLIYHK